MISDSMYTWHGFPEVKRVLESNDRELFKKIENALTEVMGPLRVALVEWYNIWLDATKNYTDSKTRQEAEKKSSLQKDKITRLIDRVQVLIDDVKQNVEEYDSF